MLKEQLPSFLAIAKKPSFWATGIIAGLLLAFFFLSGGLKSRGLEDLTVVRLNEAKDLWKTKDIKTYSLDVKVSGVEKAHHEIRVEDSKVVSMTTDGAPVAEYVWHYWSVEGLFRFLEEELVNQQNPSATFGVSESSKVYLSVTFDPALGYPAQYLRQVFGQKKTIEWDVTLSH